MVLRLLLLLAFCLGAPTALAQPVLRPVDEAAAQPDFFAFRAQLAVAVARHDAAALRAALADDVSTSFGGDGGIAEFFEMWHPERPDSELWPALAEVLALGGGFHDNGAFEAPYVAFAWPDEFDSFEYVAIVGRDVRVRAGPDAQAEVLATVAFAILARGEADAPDAQWVAVTLPDGRAGFVAARYARSPVGRRATFEKVDGAWKITALVAGD